MNRSAVKRRCKMEKTKSSTKSMAKPIPSKRILNGYNKRDKRSRLSATRTSIHQKPDTQSSLSKPQNNRKSKSDESCTVISNIEGGLNKSTVAPAFNETAKSPTAATFKSTNVDKCVKPSKTTYKNDIDKSDCIVSSGNTKSNLSFEAALRHKSKDDEVVNVKTNITREQSKSNLRRKIGNSMSTLDSSIRKKNSVKSIPCNGLADKETDGGLQKRSAFRMKKVEVSIVRRKIESSDHVVRKESSSSIEKGNKANIKITNKAKLKPKSNAFGKSTLKADLLKKQSELDSALLSNDMPQNKETKKRLKFKKKPRSTLDNTIVNGVLDQPKVQALNSNKNFKKKTRVVSLNKTSKKQDLEKVETSSREPNTSGIDKKSKKRLKSKPATNKTFSDLCASKSRPLKEKSNSHKLCKTQVTTKVDSDEGNIDLCSADSKHISSNNNLLEESNSLKTKSIESNFLKPIPKSYESSDKIILTPPPLLKPSMVHIPQSSLTILKPPPLKQRRISPQTSSLPILELPPPPPLIKMKDVARIQCNPNSIPPMRLVSPTTFSIDDKDLAFKLRSHNRGSPKKPKACVNDRCESDEMSDRTEFDDSDTLTIDPDTELLSPQLKLKLNEVDEDKEGSFITSIDLLKTCNEIHISQIVKVDKNYGSPDHPKEMKKEDSQPSEDKNITEFGIKLSADDAFDKYEFDKSDESTNLLSRLVKDAETENPCDLLEVEKSKEILNKSNDTCTTLYEIGLIGCSAKNDNCSRLSEEADIIFEDQINPPVALLKMDEKDSTRLVTNSVECNDSEAVEPVLTHTEATPVVEVVHQTLTESSAVPDFESKGDKVLSPICACIENDVTETADDFTDETFPTSDIEGCKESSILSSQPALDASHANTAYQASGILSNTDTYVSKAQKHRILLQQELTTSVADKADTPVAPTFTIFSEYSSLFESDDEGSDELSTTPLPQTIPDTPSPLLTTPLPQSFPNTPSPLLTTPLPQSFPDTPPLTSPKPPMNFTPTNASASSNTLELSDVMSTSNEIQVLTTLRFSQYLYRTINSMFILHAVNLIVDRTLRFLSMCNMEVGLELFIQNYHQLLVVHQLLITSIMRQV